MKIPTIKTFFNKTETPKKSGKVVVAKEVSAVKKTPPKKIVVKKVVLKKVAPKKLALSLKPTTKTPAAKKASLQKVVLAVTKKSTAKKTAGVKLVVASDSESFWVQDGQILNSLVALEAALKSMSPSIYAYHASTDGNHFADWVEVILADKVCATALRKATTSKSAHTVVKKHLLVLV
jgi:hypothetical protein